MNSLEYWRNRETEAKKKYIADENAYAKEIQDMYLRTLDRVQKEIDSFYTRYAAKEGITIADAKKRADKLDIEAYAAKAKKYVKSRDFSKKANDEMRLYNLTMKVNRLELLKANIGLELVQQSEDLQQFMDEKLTGRTMEELQRQAGILGESISDEAQVAKTIVNASFHNATFSERIWQNNTLLKVDLAKQLEIGLIQGKHPTVLARDLRKTWDVSQHQALRLMRTELARVQIGAQMQSYDNAGVAEYTYITCGFGDACPVCRALDGKHFKTSDMLPGENAPPMHPNCHCSTSAYVDRNSVEWSKDNEIKSSGGIYGAYNDKNDPDYRKREKIGRDLYTEITNRKKSFEIRAVSKNSGLSIDEVSRIYDHMFVRKHLLSNGTKVSKFDPDYYMAHSWIRVREGKNIQAHDLTMLYHELEEEKIMGESLEVKYEMAHNKAQKKFNYAKELQEYLKTHDA